MRANLFDLPRYTLSIILSYLQENHDNTNIAQHCGPHNRDAISLLLTNKRFSYAIMPLFKLPRLLCRTYRRCQTSNSCQSESGVHLIEEKYRFAVLPIQDPRTLLDRLNTRRLRRRIVLMSQKQMEQLQLGFQQFRGDETKNRVENRCYESMSREMCYQFGRTVKELASEEWILMQIHHELLGNGENRYNEFYTWPAQLELLRFCDDFDEECSCIRSDKEPQLLNSQSAVVGNKNKISFPSFRIERTYKTDGDINHNMARDLDYSHGKGLVEDLTLLASYPRSGNTLLRNLLERTTSICTGSDTRPDRSLSISEFTILLTWMIYIILVSDLHEYILLTKLELALEHDLVGEGLVGREKGVNSRSSGVVNVSLAYRQKIHQTAFDPVVNIVKTHFPERKGWKAVHASRVILLVRNPYDAIDSYWNLCCTNTHTQSLDESVYQKYAAKFECMARHEIKVWCEFYHYWLDVTENEKLPLLVLRYEDLILDAEREMERVLKFLTRKDDQELDAFWKWRIHHAIVQSSINKQQHICKRGLGHITDKSGDESTAIANLGSYIPRSSNGGLDSIGKSLRKNRYSKDVLLHMHDVAVSLELDRLNNNLGKIFPTWAICDRLNGIAIQDSATSNLDRQQKQRPNITLLQRFGYEIFNQDFPKNFKQPPPILVNDLTSVNKLDGSVLINESPEIRSYDDPFGRAMTTWRRSQTDGDKVPFPTVLR